MKEDPFPFHSPIPRFATLQRRHFGARCTFPCRRPSTCTLSRPGCRSPVLVLRYPQLTTPAVPHLPSRQNQTLFLARHQPLGRPKTISQATFSLLAIHPLAPTPFGVLPPSSQPFTASTVVVSPRAPTYLPTLGISSSLSSTGQTPVLRVASNNASRIPTLPRLTFPQLFADLREPELDGCFW